MTDQAETLSSLVVHVKKDAAGLLQKTILNIESKQESSLNGNKASVPALSSDPPIADRVKELLAGTEAELLKNV